MYLKDTGLENLIEVIRDMQVEAGEVLLILLAENDSLDPNELIKVLNEEKISFFGGVFPGIIYEDSRYDRGIILAKYSAPEKPYVIKDFTAVDELIPDMATLQADREQKLTALVFVDGLAGDIDLFLNRLYNHLSDTVTYIGGGAGSLSLQQKPCLFTAEGFLQNAAVVAFINLQCSLGVRHGWKKITGPSVVTRSDKNIIYELNWRNAFDVYSEIIENDSGKRPTKENFFDLAKGYPFGMFRKHSEYVVRDPIAIGDKGELICVGEVPENSVIDVLKGEKQNLVNAAGQAASECVLPGDQKADSCLVADCISRVLFLEDCFSAELAEVKKALQGISTAIVPMGALTLGEISSYGDGNLLFFNKTIVIGLFYE